MKNKKIFILISLLLTSCNTNKLDVSIYAYNLEDTFVIYIQFLVRLRVNGIFKHKQYFLKNMVDYCIFI